MPSELLAAAAAGTVLTPSAELAAALFEALESAYLHSGRLVWPTPRVLDFSSWIREQHAQRRFEDARLPRLLGEAEERELWRAVIENHRGTLDGLDSGSAARAARRARRALYEYAIPQAALAAHAAVSEESGAFVDWNRSFEERCRALNCVDLAPLLAEAPAAAQTLFWIDSPAWRPTARRWLEPRASLLRAPVVAAQKAGRLHLSGEQVELASMAAWGAQQISAQPTFRAWLCVPGLEQRRGAVIDALDAQLAPQRFALSAASDHAPYAVAGGTALSEYAPVRAALDALDAALGTLPFERLSALLRSAQLQESPQDALRAARLDVELRTHGNAEADLAAWLRLGERLAAAKEIGPMSALQRLWMLARLLAPNAQRRLLSEWIVLWVQALNAASWADRARWSSGEFQAAERLRELLAELAMADGLFGAQSHRAAQGILRRAAAETLFQPQTGVPQITVSGQWMDPWLGYDGLWVAGCSEERWPPPPAPMALLPVALQQSCGVIAASAHSQLHFAMDLQSRWLQRAPQCIFSYADDGEGRRAAASPLAPAAAADVAAAEPRPHWRMFLAAAPLLETIIDEKAPPLKRGEETLRGVATLQAQSRCAFRGFAETRLRCQPLERPVPGFNDRERGVLIHDALEQLWRELGDSAHLAALDAQRQAQLIGRAITLALAKTVRQRDPGSRWQRRELARLSSVLEKWLDVERQRQPFTVESLEQRIQFARFGELDLPVRIDRIDRLEDGARVLIDYKSGGASADWRGERPDNPQLPMYALLEPTALVAVAYARVNAADMGFIAESERPKLFRPNARPSGLEDMPDLQSLIELWRQRITRLAREFCDGEAEVAPTRSACKSCRLQGLCRVPAAAEEPLADE